MSYKRKCPACNSQIQIAESRFCLKCGENFLASHVNCGNDNDEDSSDADFFPCKWVISYSADVSTLPDEGDYPDLCDRLEGFLEAKISAKLKNVEQLESARDGETLSVRFSFEPTTPSDLEALPYVSPFEITEVRPYNDVYRDSN